jgi:hypothetical protein
MPLPDVLEFCRPVDAAWHPPGECTQLSVNLARLAPRPRWIIHPRMQLSLRRIFAGLCLVVPLWLSACGDLPEPFIGNPGANARRLAQPPTPRLAVPAPGEMLLSDAASRSFAEQLAKSLQQAEVPAVAQPSQRTDWTLMARADQHDGVVVPTFSVRDPQGKDRGNAAGAPVPAAAWSAADPTTLQQTAAEAAPKIAAVLTSIQTTLMRADPNSLYNRVPKVLVPDVTGAPGDGNTSLTREMRKRLATLGPVVQTTADGADFVVQGQVKVVPIAGRQERVEIQWIVSVPPNDERGRVVQLNEIPAGTLSRYWGDVAVVVATEASQGVENVLQRQTGHAPDADPGSAASPATIPPPATTPPPGTTPPATPQSAPRPGTGRRSTAPSSASQRSAVVPAAPLPGTVRGQQPGALLEGQTASADHGVGCAPMASDQHEDCRLQQQSPLGRGGRG